MVDEKTASGPIDFTFARHYSLICMQTSTCNQNEDRSGKFTRSSKPGAEIFGRQPRIWSDRTKAATRAAGKSARSCHANMPVTGSLTSATCQQFARK